jgi:hypothetical protein
MRAIAFSMQFRGSTKLLSPGVLTAQASAPSGGEVTRIDRDGVHSTFEAHEGGEALLERRLTFVDAARFEDVGTISFGNGHALRFRSIDPGSLVQAGDSLRHGTAAWEIDGGSGSFEGATGRIVSNFLLAETGELTDRELGVLFIPEDERSAP